MDGHCPQVFFTAAAGKRIKAVSNAPGINDDNRAAFCPVSGGELEEITLDIVDDNGVRPGEKLADSQKPLAPACWRVNKQVSEFPPGRAATHSKQSAVRTNTKKEACSPVGRIGADEWMQFVRTGKPCGVNMFF
jgi:hypothetical protein